MRRNKTFRNAEQEVDVLTQIDSDPAVLALITCTFLLFEAVMNQFCKVRKNKAPWWKRPTIPGT